MSNLAILRGLLAYVDNVDGKGADAFARALLGHPELGPKFGTVSFETLRNALLGMSPRICAAATSAADELTANLMAQMTGKSKGGHS